MALFCYVCAILLVYEGRMGVQRGIMYCCLGV